MALYFVAVSESADGWTSSIIQGQAIYIRASNRSAVIKCRSQDQVYLRYQIHALTARELPC